jgi:aldehyde dehydrogenase (NAD+)
MPGMHRSDQVTDYEIVIDGESSAAVSGERFDVTYPYTGDVWATVPRGDSTDVDQAVRAARECFESDRWTGLSATDRGELLYALADEIEAHVDELAELESLSNGKLIREMQGQVESLPDWYRYYAGLADKIHGDTIPVEQEEMFNFTQPEPYGVVGAITPWNSPLSLATYKIAPAVAAGNTIVLKPSEITPVSAIRLAELASDAGFPDGALNVVTGFEEPGKALASHDDIDKLAFTGSDSAGRSVAKAAGEKIVPVTLELGGKSPNIVFPEADLDNALNGVIKGIFAASGQTCVAGSRLFLHESIHNEFVERLVERAEDITMDDPLDPETEIGPIAFQGQFEKVKEHVENALSEGATLATGGEPREDLPGGLFYPPTILTDVTNDMAVAQEEIFGPVLSVIPFATEDEAVTKANDSRYGLAAGIWTTDISRAVRMKDRLEAGVVWINTYRKSSFTTPFGGHKDSGIGVEKGKAAVQEYYQTKSVWISTKDSVSDPFKLI